MPAASLIKIAPHWLSSLPSKTLSVLKYSAALLIVGQLVGCQTTYYAAWEKLGYEKREILTSRVESARDAQEQAREEVVSALESFSQAVNYEGGELEKQYRRFKSQLENSEQAAQNVRDRIVKVEATAGALFDEWTDELDSYNSVSLRARSAEQLKSTKTRYTKMIKAMKVARDRLDPALSPLQDHVLFLKHNLNASALSSLKSELKSIDAQVNRLISDINKAVAEADSFIKQLG